MEKCSLNLRRESKLQKVYKIPTFIFSGHISMSISFCLGPDSNGSIVLHNMDMPKLIVCREESKVKFKNAKRGEGSRWWSKKTWSSPPTIDISNIYLHVEQFSRKTNWKLAELLHNQGCKKDSPTYTAIPSSS